MDEVDRADEMQMELLQRAIDAARGLCVELIPVGECYNCSEPLASGLRFCDSDCRDDYEKRRKHGYDA